jgi:hypothetical protein
MVPLDLAIDELDAVCRTCVHLRLRRCPPNFDLRAFLTGRLRGKDQSLAAKVEHLSEEQLLALCHLVVERQRWLD